MHMDSSRRGHNHAHWEHDAPVEAPATQSAREVALHHWMRRAHLPVHPLAPLGLIVLGIVHCALIASLWDEEVLLDRTLSVTAFAVLAFAMAPGIGLIATGAWTLTESVFRHWAHRLEQRRHP